MAIPVTNIPVLTGEVAERFIEQCEYNAKHLAVSEWSQEREDRFNRIMERSMELQRKLCLGASAYCGACPFGICSSKSERWA